MLSIITPHYNRHDYLKELAKVLVPQLTEETEWLIIDDNSDNKDFSYINSDYVKLIRLDTNSGGASVPRNVGLDNAKGEYITFIDSDDLVSPDYIEEIRKTFIYNYDYCYFGWSSRVVEVKGEPPSWNCCVWNCIYKKDLIGETRFDPNLKIAEDYKFNQKVRKGKCRTIRKILYYYNIDTPNSLIKRGGN